MSEAHSPEIASDRISDTALNNGQGTGEVLEARAGRAREAARAYADKAKGRAMAAGQKITATVRGRPMVSTASAFGAGIATGLILSGFAWARGAPRRGPRDVRDYP